MNKLFDFRSFWTKHRPVDEAVNGSKDQLGMLIRNPQALVLMLDFDGVLHPYESGSLTQLPILEEWLASKPDVDVVISSNWRESHTLAQLKSYFNETLRDRVIGTTPYFYEKSRLDEIQDVVAKYGIRSWIALDDDVDEFNDQHRLVVTDASKGLTVETIADLDRLYYMRNFVA